MFQKTPNLPYFDENSDIDDSNENENLEELYENDGDNDGDDKELDYNEEEL